MWEMLIPMLATGFLSGVASATEKRPKVTQESMLALIPQWQEAVRRAGYASIPGMTTSLADLAPKVGMTNESQATIRYAEIADAVSKAEQEAAKLGVQAMSVASQLPYNEGWFSRFLKGFIGSLPLASDIGTLIMKMKLLSSLSGGSPTGATASSGNIVSTNTDYEQMGKLLIPMIIQ